MRVPVGAGVGVGTSEGVGSGVGLGVGLGGSRGKDGCWCGRWCVRGCGRFSIPCLPLTFPPSFFPFLLFFPFSSPPPFFPSYIVAFFSRGSCAGSRNASGSSQRPRAKLVSRRSFDEQTEAPIAFVAIVTFDLK